MNGDWAGLRDGLGDGIQSSIRSSVHLLLPRSRCVIPRWAAAGPCEVPLVARGPSPLAAPHGPSPLTGLRLRAPLAHVPILPAWFLASDLRLWTSLSLRQG